jgi:predicted ATPase
VQFTVLPAGSSPSSSPSGEAFLITDDWDDWFRYSTLYHLVIFDTAGNEHSIGDVKIGEFDMVENQRRPNIPDQFELLSERFFSLGQDVSYYESLSHLGTDIRDDVLSATRDVARDRTLFRRALGQDVMGTSLLRSVSRSTVLGQFERLTRGGAALSSYHFAYTTSVDPKRDAVTAELTFDVEPESEPPTNIHVIIGRNGVGKTHLLNNMTRSLMGEGGGPDDVGSFDMPGDDAQEPFAGLVSVTFSAFDPFEPISVPRNKATGLRFTYVGLKRIRREANEKPLAPKSHRALATEFGSSVRVCLQGARLARWRRALTMLEGDPIFADAQVADLANADADGEQLTEQARELFRRLSSGHKIVLLTITRLVESVEERSLVLLDEPEAHLHPPLLAAFVRALSDLLINRNGVAIIATHSPVVLQEVPRHCAWKLHRFGYSLVAERPEIETFGENVGVLTREVFGLEVTRSGFHKMIEDAINAGDDYLDIQRRFGGRLGAEAQAIARALLAARNSVR